MYLTFKDFLNFHEQETIGVPTAGQNGIAGSPQNQNQNINNDPDEQKKKQIATITQQKVSQTQSLANNPQADPKTVSKQVKEIDDLNKQLTAMNNKSKLKDAAQQAQNALSQPNQGM